MSVFLTGLMADKLGSYAVTFYTAGAIQIVGASITSLMAFIKQQPEEASKARCYDEEHSVTEKRTEFRKLRKASRRNEQDFFFF